MAETGYAPEADRDERSMDNHGVPSEYQDLVPRVDRLGDHYHTLSNHLRTLSGEHPTPQAQALMQLVDQRAGASPEMIFAADNRANNLIAESETRAAFDITVANLTRVLAGSDRYEGVRPIVMYDNLDDGATLSLAETRAMAAELAGLLGTTRATAGPDGQVIWDTVIPGVRVHVRQPDPDDPDRMSFAASYSRAVASPTSNIPVLPQAQQAQARRDPQYIATAANPMLRPPRGSLKSYAPTTDLPTSDAHPVTRINPTGLKPPSTRRPLASSDNLKPLPPRPDVEGRNPAAVMYSHLDHFADNLHRGQGTQEGDLVAFRDLLARRELEVESQPRPDIINDMRAAQAVESALRLAMNHVSPRQGVTDRDMELYHHEGNPADPVTAAVIRELETVFRADHAKAKRSEHEAPLREHRRRTSRYDMATALPGYSIRVERTLYSKGTTNREGKAKQPDLRILLVRQS